MRNLILSLYILLLSASVAGADIVTIAKREIGHGETTANNRGPHIRRFMQGQDNLPWCAGFVSWVMDQAGYKELDYSLSAKAIYNQAKSKDMLTNDPQPGDLVAFWRTSPSSWTGHIGIVVEASDTHIKAIEGNVGAFPALVREFTYPKNAIPRLLGFIRLKGGAR